MFNNIFRRDDKEEKEEISKPTNVKHVGGIKFDPRKGIFDTKNVPQEWKIIFKNAGITKNDLKDEEFATEIFEKILSEMPDCEAESQQQGRYLILIIISF